MNNDSLADWLAFSYIRKLGIRKKLRLLALLDSPTSILQADFKALRQLGISEEEYTQLRQPNWRQVDKDLAWIEKNAGGIITLADPYYPDLLKEIASPPLVLFIKGQAELLKTQQLAMVGSRHPTRQGLQITKAFANELASYGLTITSGLAQGIDSASHTGALETGTTIAVMGAGLAHIYPARNKPLAEKIAQAGLLVSEFSPNTPPRATHFPQRNRIISGLSLGIIVVEAAQKSGSLITARTALEQGREVFAIPGSIYNPLSKGCHYLIGQGAKLVEKTQDVFEELVEIQGVNSRELLQKRINEETIKQEFDKSEPKRMDFSGKYATLLGCLDSVPTPVDLLVEQSQLPTEIISAQLLELELQGKVASEIGGYYLLDR